MAGKLFGLRRGGGVWSAATGVGIRSATGTAWAAIAILLTITAEGAEPGQAARPSEFLLLVQIALLIAVGRGLGDVMQRIGQPSVMGELLAGLLLGPSLFGWVWPAAQGAIFPSSPEQKALLDGIAQFGILLLLLLTGMETDLGLVRKVGKAAVAVSITGIVIPFICGFALGEVLPPNLLPHPEARLIASLFLGTLRLSSGRSARSLARNPDYRASCRSEDPPEQKPRW